MVCDRKHLIVRDKHALITAHRWGPAASESAAAGTRQVERSRVRSMVSCPPRQIQLVHADGDLTRLHQLVHEAIDRPGVDELAVAFRVIADLSIAFGDLNYQDLKIASERCPLLARPWARFSRSQYAIQIEQGTFDEMGY